MTSAEEVATHYVQLVGSPVRFWSHTRLVKCLLAAAGTVMLLSIASTNSWTATVLKLTSKRPVPHTGTWCGSEGAATYTKVTLKTVVDRTIYGLLPFDETYGETKFEASDVIRVGDQFFVVCDSSWSILRLSESLPLLSHDNALIRHDDSFTPPEGEDSGFEAIFFDASSTMYEKEDTFYVVRESVKDSNSGAYNAEILKIQIHGQAYHVVETCRSEFQFQGDSKGFEGATSLRGQDGILYILGLCEGNYCSETKGKEVGNGRVVVMKRSEAHEAPGGCVWKTVTTLELPKSVDFVDYSAFALHHSNAAVAITSQENSQLWIGALSGGSDGKFDPAAASFSEGTIYDFPRVASGSCDVQYCNIEGIHWVTPGSDKHKIGETPPMLVAVSDKMKSKGRQLSACADKDQSVHLFTVPANKAQS